MNSVPACSSILSHSSRTKNLSLSSFKCPVFARSRTRPGVPTATCGGSWVNFSLCWATGTPPNRVSVLRFKKYFPRRSNSFVIWNASSLVWHRTIHCGLSPSKSNWCKIDKTKTAVFPIPDFAWHTRSFPRIQNGIASCCTIVVSWCSVW